MATLIFGALIFGLLIDNIIPGELIIKGIVSRHGSHEHDILPQWLKVSSGILMAMLVVNIYIQKLVKRKKNKMPGRGGRHYEQLKMKELKIKVEGMTCSHCKITVEKNIGAITGVKNVSADVSRDEVIITGENINLDIVKSAVENTGYNYRGVTD